MIIYVLFLPVALSAQDNRDPFIETQLNRLHMDYQIDDDGDFLVRIHLDNQRTQLVHIRSQVNHYRQAQVREIFSLAAAFHQELPSPLCEKLFEDSYTSRYTGSWALTQTEGLYTLLYLIKIPSHVSDDYLLACIMESALACDEMELYLGSQEDTY